MWRIHVAFVGVCANRQMLLISSDIDDLLRQMNDYVPPTVGKWITPESV